MHDTPLMASIGGRSSRQTSGVARRQTTRIKDTIVILRFRATQLVIILRLLKSQWRRVLASLAEGRECRSRPEIAFGHAGNTRTVGTQSWHEWHLECHQQDEVEHG
jgi:hypothetical protein